MALRSAGRNAVSLMASQRTEMTHGNISGRRVVPASGGSPYGRLDPIYRESFNQATYAVYSYGTPIAWFVETDGGQWLMPDVKYSVTTTNHQNALWLAVHNAGYLMVGLTPAWFVTRDDKPISPALPTEDDAYTWLLKHQGNSTDWAIRHEGYAVAQRAAAALPVAAK